MHTYDVTAQVNRHQTYNGTVSAHFHTVQQTFTLHFPEAQDPGSPRMSRMKHFLQEWIEEDPRVRRVRFYEDERLEDRVEPSEDPAQEL